MTPRPTDPSFSAPPGSTPSTPVRRRTALAALTTASLLVGAGVAALPAAAADDGTDGSTTLSIVDINDFHGRIDANTVKFAGTVEQLKAKNPTGTLFLSVGDNVGASLFASATQDDTPTLDVLNSLGLAASSVGNHEFDKGFADLTDRIKGEADFPYLGANVYTKGTTTPALPEYAIEDVDGLKVGVIGAVTVETPTLVTPSGISGLDFGDPVAAVNRVADQLTDGNPANGEADVLVAAIHEGAGAGTPDGATLAQEVAGGGAFADIVEKTSPKVAAILTGHTHKQYAWDAPIPGTDRTRPIIQTGSYGENVGYTTLTLDAKHQVTGYTVQNVARTTTDDATLAAQFPAVAKVKGIVDSALAYANEVGSKKIGEVSADVTTAFTKGSYVDGRWVGTVRDDRASESTLGNLVANSLRDSLADSSRGGAQIGVVNPGGLRSELLYAPDGTITYAEANSVLPFVNNLWTVTLTGAQLRTMLEEQWQTDAAGNRPSRPYLQLGLSDNVTYTARTTDPNATPGSNILDVFVDGKLVKDSDTFRVGTFSFLATGGDNFRVFTQGTDARDSGLIDRDAWIAYLTAHSPVAPSFARSHAVATDVSSSVEAGQKASASLAGLDLTSQGSPQNTAVETYLVPDGAAFDPAKPGTSLGSSPVADGAASVAVTVPASTKAGAYELVTVAAPSGTVVRVPLTVTAAPAPVAPPKLKAVSATSFCFFGKAYVLSGALNGERSQALDIRLTTPFGNDKFTKVKAGWPVASLHATGKSSIPAGKLTAASYYWDGVGHYKVYEASYKAISCR